MNIYICADMEGVSGLGTAEQLKIDSPQYADAQRLAADDINAAVDAAFSGGAEKVVVCDAHAGGGRIGIRGLDARAFYELPNCGKLMPSLDESFSGIVLIGQHARAGTLNGFLDHTISSSSWFEYKINDQVVGEIGIQGAYAGYYDVPVIAISGDYGAVEEARKLFAGIGCAIVKWGIGRNRAKCLPLPRAHDAIREAVQKGLSAAQQLKPYKPSLPVTIELKVCRSDMADELTARVGVQRIDARTLRWQAATLLEICPW